MTSTTDFHSRFIHVVMISMMVQSVLSIIFTTPKCFVVFIQSIRSSLLRTGMSVLCHPLRRSANILARYHAPSPLAGPGNPTPNSTLINGLGRYSGGPKSPLAVINVSSGKRYRFRLVSMSCNPNFVFSIASHNLVSVFNFSIALEESILFLDDNRSRRHQHHTSCGRFHSYIRRSTLLLHISC